LYSILDYEGGHYRRYTKKELKEKMQKAGFIIEKCFYINIFGALGWYFNHVLLKKRVYSLTAFKAYNALVPIFQFFEGIVKPPLGLSIFIVARK
jgi:hypothetical protein